MKCQNAIFFCSVTEFQINLILISCAFAITGDNWNGIMKDTLRDNCDDEVCTYRFRMISNNTISNVFFLHFFVSG